MFIWIIIVCIWLMFLILYIVIHFYEKSIMRFDIIYYVNKYTENKSYGGPEEGGWWYRWGIFDKCEGMFTNKQEAYRYANKLTIECDKNNREKGAEGDINSILCAGVESIIMETNQGKDWSEDKVYD